MHIPRKLIKSDRRKIIDILDKFQFFQGQRAGRELWLNKPVEVQEEDLENFNKDIRTIRDYICDLETSVKKYKDLEEQGLLLKLPCKVGDTVYFAELNRIYSRRNYLTCVIDEFTIDRNECYAVLNANEPFFAMRRFKAVNIKHFGEIVFLTKEEAEAKLKELINE